MKRTVAIMLLTATMATGQLLAQEQATPKQSHNSVYLEFGGNGPLWNIAYDRVIFNKGYSKISMAAGFQIIPKIWHAKTPFYSLSPQVNYLFGGKHNIEIGGGIVIGIQDAGLYFLAIPRAGYRYQDFSKNGLFFKAGFTPVTTIKTSTGYPYQKMEAHAGIAVGYSF